LTVSFVFFYLSGSCSLFPYVTKVIKALSEKIRGKYLHGLVKEKLGNRKLNHLISTKILCKNQWIWSYPSSERISRFGYDQQLNIKECEQTIYVCVCVLMYVCIAKTTINTLSCQTTRQEEQKVNKIIRRWASKNIFKSATAFSDDSYLTTERITYYSFLVTIKKNKNSRITCR
jgi:hypothetical protein